MALTKKDYENIKKIYHLTSIIRDKYQLLSNLESQDKENTKEYRSALKSLKKLIENEKKLYKSANITPEKSEEIANYIVIDRNMLKEPQDTESIILSNEIKLNERRILNKLKRIAFSDINTLSKKLDLDNLTEIFSYVGDEDQANDIKKQVYSGIKAQDAIDDDIYYAFIKLLDEFISSNKKDKYINDKLTRAKYNLSFINETIEPLMIQDNFHIPKLYLSAKLIADMYQVDDFVYNQFISLKIPEKVSLQLAKILATEDLLYTQKDTIVSTSLRQLLLRAYYIFLDDDTLEDINYKFHELIESADYTKKHINNKASESSIIQTFKHIKKDKEKPYILSLKPLK